MEMIVNLPVVKMKDISADIEAFEEMKAVKKQLENVQKEMRIIEYLIANQGRVLSREQIALKIWGYDSDSEYNNVEVYMSFARKKLAYVESGCEIKAVRGIGYELRQRDVR